LVYNIHRLFFLEGEEKSEFVFKSDLEFDLEEECSLMVSQFDFEEEIPIGEETGCSRNESGN